MEAVKIRLVLVEPELWRADIVSRHGDRYSRLSGRGRTPLKALMRLHDRLVNLCEVVLMKIDEDRRTPRPGDHMTLQAQAPAAIPIFVSQRRLAKLLGITADTLGKWAEVCPVWGHDGRSRRRDGTLERTLWHHTGKLPLLQAVVMGTMSEADAWARWQVQRALIGYEGVKPNRVDPRRGEVTEGLVKKGGAIPRSAAPPPPDPKGSKT